MRDIVDDEVCIATDQQRIWQPFSRTDDLAREKAIVLDRGEGVWLWDTEGRRYLDGVGALESMAIGHGRVELAVAAEEQMRRLAFLDVFRYASQPALDLSEELIRIAPSGMSQVHFTPGGSEAVEVALKLAVQYHWLNGEPDRRLVVCRQGAYHGVTYGAMNCDGGYWSTRNDIYLGDQRFGVVATGPASGADWGTGARHTAGAAEFERVVAEVGPDRVSAIIVDAVATASGVATPPADDLRALRSLADRHGILLIVDEVITGFCRTGQMFASDLFGVSPDFMPISKALSSGYLPIGACLVGDRVTERFRSAPTDNVFAHGHTYGGHPVACAVALENVRILQDEQLHLRASEMGSYLREGLHSLRDHPTFIAERGVGMLNGLEIVGEDDGAGRFGTAASAGTWVRKRCRELGLITLTVHPGTVLLLAPPLVIDTSAIDHLVEILDQALSDLESAR